MAIPYGEAIASLDRLTNALGNSDDAVVAGARDEVKGWRTQLTKGEIQPRQLPGLYSAYVGSSNPAVARAFSGERRVIGAMSNPEYGSAWYR